ncbi:MAG: esterase-like activity of phytase family protein, partial [Solirubrobacterales bacterium]|nr:esterase-like activity of phytase family protein [Solirubrobacterales bacterium]
MRIGTTWRPPMAVGAVVAAGALALPLGGSALADRGDGRQGHHGHGAHGKPHGHGKAHSYGRSKGRGHGWHAPRGWRRHVRHWAPPRPRHRIGGFDHVGTFDVPDNLLAGDPFDTTATSAEIVDTTRDGRTLVYTDALSGRLGFVDITDRRAPAALGALDLPGDPTSVVVHGRFALVAIATNADPDGAGPLNEYDAPSGELVVIDIATRDIVKTVELAGQPDSLAISPDGSYLAIVIENERDEDENDGLIPQLPAGSLQVLSLRTLHRASPVLRQVDLTGLAEVAPEDPEPEYVDINRRNLAVVSLQENNHLAIVDLGRAKVKRHFSAGAVALENVDATEEDLGPQGAGLIDPSESILRRREPDSVAWIDDDTFATANEGDYEYEGGVGEDEGGSRGFTLFNVRGHVEWESGASFEHEVIRAGHYPEARSENKGNEPEGLEYGELGGRELLFVGSERANVVGVYDVGGRRPRFLHLLPTAIGPEGIEAIAHRGLVAVSGEVDGVDEGFPAIRPLITLYEAGRTPGYPQVASVDSGATPIPWVALSGLSGDPHRRDTLWAVSDSVLAQAYVYELDVSGRPARIVDRIPVGEVEVADQKLGDYDLEGVFARPKGGFWLASEGRTNAGSSRPNLLVRTDAAGNVLDSVELPAGLVAGATSSGFEGVTATGSAAAGDEAVWAVIQREWADDPAGAVKIARYEVATGEWTFARYPLDAVASPAADWVGLSEIT